jgi:2-polyprenyl-6-methoxyphenol hydroxylase-like FAD-dependent oxidoreductase
MPFRVGVVGGSLAGLAAANVLQRLGHSVQVYEKFPSVLDQRGSSLGFVDNALWEYVRGAPMLRLGRRANCAQGAYYYGDLWQYLYDGLEPDSVRFGVTVADLGSAPTTQPSVDGQVFDAVIIADGGFSALRPYVNGHEHQPEYAGQVVFRVKVDRRDFPDFANEGGYEEASAFAMMLQVVQNSGQEWIMGGIGVGVPEHEVIRPADGANRQDMAAGMLLPAWFMPFVRRVFRRHTSVARWLELAHATGKITPQPLYEFKADQVANGRLLMLGDAAHMASPRTASGAHTGVLDAASLVAAFSANPTNIDRAIAAYAPGGVQRARELYVRSKQVSAPLVYRAETDQRTVG